MERPDMRTIDWYIGDRGIGKTSIIKYLCTNHDGCLCSGAKMSDMQYAIINYCEANNGRCPRLVLIPLWFTTNVGKIDYEGLESVKDMLFCSGKYKGGTVIANPCHLFIFANNRPDFDDEKIIVHNLADYY